MENGRDTLYMRTPSSWWHDPWREGLVSGNGRVGADVYGGVKDETIMLTHHRLWHQGKESALPDVSAAFRRLRQLMDEERFQEASWTVVNALKAQGYETKLQSPFPAADLRVQIRPVAGFTEYRRGIHMNSGEVFSAWREGNSQRTSRLFVSRARPVAVKRITSSQSDLCLSFSLSPHRNPGSEGLETYGQHILESMECVSRAPYLCYTARNDDGSLYGVCVKVFSNTGTIQTERDTLTVQGAGDCLALIFVFADERRDRETVLEEACNALDAVPADYDALLSEHKKIHEAWYRSADFCLPAQENGHSNEELLLEAYGGKQPAELIEKLWRYGRYLFICGTDPEADPFPMYGLWAGDYRLMWPHNMANENIQMIYWHVFAGNLLPFHKAFFRYYNERIPAFQNNAKKLFGMRGLYMTAGTTPGVSAPNQVVPVIMNWVGAAGWIAQHYARYARYTEDPGFFEESILPFLLEVAAFYEDFICFAPDGSVRFYPSVSPENTPGNFMPPKHIQMAHPMPTTVNSTIDLAILKEFLTNMCAFAETWPRLQSHVPAWKKILSAIPEYRVNDQGAVREWQDERFRERYDHRHLSHLYPVFPGDEVNMLSKPELLPAFERAVRLREIDAQTGWSQAHMAAIYARLERAEDAMDCLNKMAQSCLTNSFFTLHNDWRGMNITLNMDPAPVQLDAIMGYVNAVQEMLVYASGNLLKLLPALPAVLSRGEIRSFRYPDGLIDMLWDLPEKTFRASITAIRDHTVLVSMPKGFSAFLLNGKRWSAGENGLFDLSLAEGQTAEITVE
ncbi:MAG: glycoside hydrolase N-terminal domain-containing protein [Clostridia bacterium]|nr:glycoside hydrolase N-terminal domain-containing protein [Clostridia bacterium]